MVKIFLMGMMLNSCMRLRVVHWRTVLSRAIQITRVVTRFQLVLGAWGGPSHHSRASCCLATSRDFDSIRILVLWKTYKAVTLKMKFLFLIRVDFP